MTKFCSTCRIEKPIEAFNKNRYRLDGLQTKCRLCDSKRARENYHAKYKVAAKASVTKRRKQLKETLTEYKQLRKCERCGDKRYYVLEFHHLHSKKNNIANMIANANSWERILKEIEKCQLLCANCHKEVHWISSLAGKALV